MKLEFLMCGSPVEAFWSQAAIFRVGLDYLGGPYRDARLVLCVGSPNPPEPLPDRWKKWFSRIEVRRASDESFEMYGNGAQGQETYRQINPDCDISVLCDADTLLIKPFPEDFIAQMAKAPAICGVVAHYPPPLEAYPWAPDPGIKTDAELWQRAAQKVLGREIDLQTPYSMGPLRLGPSFYVNHGFIAGPPKLLIALGKTIDEIRLDIRSILNNDFYEQIALAMAIERGNLPHRRLPMRFNFPNDTNAVEQFPEEMNHVVLLHYLRTTMFDRHKIFGSEREFLDFLSLPLSGINEIFRSHIADITGGSYPFA